MPVLLSPPIEVIADSPELPAALAESRMSYARELRAALGVRGAPTSIERTGAFRGVERYAYDGQGDAILFGVFVVAPGRDKGAEFLRVGALVRADDCTLAGATWSKGAVPLVGMPMELIEAGPPLASAKGRMPREVSVVRFEAETKGPWRRALGIVAEAIAGERLAARSLPVSGTLTRLACAWHSFVRTVSASPGAGVLPAPRALDETSYPRRAHRVVRATFDMDPGKVTADAGAAWPRAVSRVELLGGVFGEKKETLVPARPPAEPVAPARLGAALAAALEAGATPAAGVHDVRKADFKILRRDRRWIYLDRGRAYGLEVGTHLVGPGNAKLHVIHFAPGEKEIDVAVALLRDEDASAPLKAGDVVGFDPTQFPVRAGGAGAGVGPGGRLETQPL